MLRARCSQTSVTALKFIDRDYVAAGCGMFLSIYNWRTAQLIRSRQVFTLNKIHGIDVDGSNLVLWGGNELVVVKDSLEQVEKHTLKDRIIHVRYIGNRFYVLTAHNEVHIIDDSGDRVIMCDERSILYSGSLYITEQTKLVAAGTVFGGVVIWDLTTAQIMHRFEAHEGSIFDVAWNENGSQIASCSDDRAIIVFDLQTGHVVAKGWGHISRIWKLQFVDAKHLISAAEDCSVRLWSMAGSDELYCTKILTGHRGKSVWALDVQGNVAVSGGGDGRIMLWDLDTPEQVKKWDAADLFGGSVRSCAVLDDGTAAITTSAGQAFRYDDDQWSPLGNNLGSVATVKASHGVFYAVSSRGNVLRFDGEVQEFELGYPVLDFFVLGHDELLIVPIPPRRELVVHSLKTMERLLPIPDNFGQPTCAISSDGQIFVGSRKGDLVAYNIAGVQTVFLKALGHDAVTSLSIENGVLQATNRVSEVGAFAAGTLKRLLKTRSRKKGSIEGQHRHSQGRLMWGFQNDTFLAWNASLGFEFLSIPCGGSHRPWNFRVLGDRSMFVYMRAGELYLHTLASPSPKFADSLLQHGTHGREIRGMGTSPVNQLLLATASEDTTVNLGWISNDYTFVEPRVTITDGHVSGIQALHWHPDGHHLFTGAGQGELVQWSVVTEGKEIFANEASRMPVKRTVQQELRIMDFALHGEYVAVAYSDSSFRIWRIINGYWSLVAESRYRECCLLNIDIVDHSTGWWVFISATDGHLVGYKWHQGDLSKQFQYKIHQSSVRTSQIVADGDALVHYSGGDDNALHAVVLVSGEIRELFHIPGAHSSAITALVVKPNYLLSVGSDQQIKIWSREGALLGSAYTGVSDTGDLVVQENHIITGGIGIEFFDYSV